MFVFNCIIQRSKLCRNGELFVRFDGNVSEKSGFILVKMLVYTEGVQREIKLKLTHSYGEHIAFQLPKKLCVLRGYVLNKKNELIKQNYSIFALSFNAVKLNHT